MNRRQQKPTQIFKDWLKKQLSTRPAGSRLPTTDELARSFSISPRTANSILKEFVERGKFVRIQGRGTFIPDKTDHPFESISSAKSSSQHIADTLREAIGLGEIKAGEQLPSLKYMVRQYHATPATIKKAYELLQKDRLIFRMGRHYWVGRLKGASKAARGKDICFFVNNKDSFKMKLQKDELCESFIELERTLSEQGFSFNFIESKNIASVLQQWLKKGTLPYGIVISMIFDEMFVADLDVIQDFLRSAKKRYGVSIPVVADYRGGHLFKRYPGISVFNTGALSTESSRHVAQFLVAGKYSKACVFAPHTQPTGNFWSIARLIKIFSETQNISPHIGVSYKIVESPDKKMTAARYLERFYPTTKFMLIIQKYRKMDDDIFQQIIDLESSFYKALENSAAADIWIFSTISLALKAINWCNRNRIKVPAKKAILCLENSTEYFHEGVSFCGPDLRALGYLMAHTIIGDIAISKTRKGYVRSPVQLIERHTTQ